MRHDTTGPAELQAKRLRIDCLGRSLLYSAVGRLGVEPISLSGPRNRGPIRSAASAALGTPAR